MKRSSPSEQSDYSTINAIQRTISLLEHLATARQGMSVTELGDELSLNKATAFRILASLQRSGYVEQDPLTQRYRLTLKIASLAFALIDTIGFEDVCQPYLNELAREVDELVQLAVVQGDDMIFVAKAEVNRRVKVVPLLGRRVTLHVSAGAKVWLASLPEGEAIRIVLGQGMPQLTSRTITSISGLLQEWEQVRRQGYALSLQEFWEDVSAVAAPVRARSGQVVAAVTVAGPSSRLTEEVVRSLAPRLIATADTISRVWPQWTEPVPPPIRDRALTPG